MHRRSVVAFAAAVLSLGSLGFAQATERDESIDDLKRQIAELRERLRDLESRAAPSASSPGLEAEIADFAKRLRRQDEGMGNVSAPGAQSVTFGGEARWRAEVYKNADFTLGNSNDDERVLQRIRVNMGVELDERMRGFFELQDSRAFGEETPTASFGGHGLDTSNDLFFRQAYAEMDDLFESGWSLRAGRQLLNYGDGRVLSEFDWDQVGNTFEGAKLMGKFDELSVDLFAMKLFEDFFAGPFPGANDVDLYGLYGSYAMDEELAFDAYALYLSIDGVVPPPGPLTNPNSLAQQRLTLGTRLKGTMEMLDFSGEIATQQNERTAGEFDPGVGAFVDSHVHFSEAYAMAGEVGLTLEDVEWTPRFAAAYSRGSDHWLNLFPDFHSHAGLMDIVPFWTNLIDYEASVGLKPMEDWDLKAAWHWFKFHQRSVVAADSRNIGQEFDVVLSGRCTDHLRAALGWGHFFPRSGLDDLSTTASAAWVIPAGADHDADFFYLSMEVLF